MQEGEDYISTLTMIPLDLAERNFVAHAWRTWAPGTRENRGYTGMELPQKKYYRQRAHSNPLADHTFDYPVNPESADWRKHYPRYESKEDLKVGIYWKQVGPACKIKISESRYNI